jgi:hypothetical protein
MIGDEIKMEFPLKGFLAETGKRIFISLNPDFEKSLSV